MAADESRDAVTKDSSDAVELGVWRWGLYLLSEDTLKRCASSVRGFWGSLLYNYWQRWLYKLYPWDDAGFLQVVIFWWKPPTL